MSKKNIYGKSRKNFSKKSNKKHNSAATPKPTAIANIPPCDTMSYATSSPVMPASTASKVSCDVGAAHPAGGTIFAIDPFCPYKESDDDADFPGTKMCPFLEAVGKLRGNYKMKDDAVEIIFGFNLPGIAQYKQAATMLRPEMRLKLLDLWDVFCAAVQSGASEAELRGHLQTLYNVFLPFLKEVSANRPNDATDGGPSEQDLIDAYERDQYLKRKALGEPVLFHDGRLYFEKIIFEHGYQPAPYPGLDLYQQHGELVDPTAFARWLDHMAPERKERENEGVGFFGCPVCPVHADSMAWFFSLIYDLFGSESYRAFVKSKGIPMMSLSSFAALIHAPSFMGHMRQG